MTVLPIKSIKSASLIASVVVAAIGTFREFYVGFFGTDTILGGLRPLALDQENALPAWYSSALLLAIAALLGASMFAAHNAGEKWVRYWGLLAMVFVMLSLDESASFHEMAKDPVRDLLTVSGALQFAWVIPAGILVLILALAYIPFLHALPKKVAFGFLAAGAIYVLGAIGFEMIGALLASEGDYGSERYVAVTTLEEIIEIAGLTVFIAVLCDHLIRQYRFTSIALKGDKD